MYGGTSINISTMRHGTATKSTFSQLPIIFLILILILSHCTFKLYVCKSFPKM